MAIAAIAAAVWVWNDPPELIASTEGTWASDYDYLQMIMRISALSIASAIVALCLAPSAARLVRLLRPRWRALYTRLALIATSLFLATFVVQAGRWQFGAFDYNDIMELGWRQFLGQRPYVDFPASTPPLFNIGIKFAFNHFGVSWDASLYLTAIFTVATFLWLYWLLRRLQLGTLAGLATAFTIEAAAMLILSFWWYNNITLILATVAFLSALVYLRDEQAISTQISYGAALALLSLTKPNIAGITLVASALLVLIAAHNKIRALAITLAAAALALAILLVNHVSIPVLIATYRAVAQERGFGSIGFDQMNDYEQMSGLAWLAVLMLPFGVLVPRLFTQLRQKQWRAAATAAFLLLAPVVAGFGIATNGEASQVECTLLLAAGAVLAFGLRWNGAIVRRIYIALVFSYTATNLALGAERIRVYDIGAGEFFEWQNNRNLIPAGVLKNLRVSSTMIDVEQEIQHALAANPGPYYFGPRVDFNYPVFAIPAPDHLPAWWHPGTAFGRDQVPHLIQLWQAHRFQTLIFLKDDYTYYPPEFLALIDREYTRDDSNPSITVYRLRTPVNLPR